MADDGMSASQLRQRYGPCPYLLHPALYSLLTPSLSPIRRMHMYSIRHASTCTRRVVVAGCPLTARWAWCGAARGGTAADSDLSASQLRGRYGVENKNFGASNDNTMQMIVGAVVCLIVTVGMFFYLKSNGH